MTARRRFELSIGGLCFAVSLPPGASLLEGNPSYGPFLDSVAPEPGPPEVTLPVELAVGGAPDVSTLPQVFDADGTWTLHRGAGELLLSLRTRGGRDPYLWLARLPDEDGAPIVVHCGDRLVERRGDGVRLHNPLHYPLDQLLMTLVLPRLGGLVIHAAGFARGRRGALFAGVSGAGKTTLSRLLGTSDELLGLSDDRVLVRRAEGGFFVCGTPWSGEGRVAANRAAELSGLVFLHKAETPSLTEISPAKALAQLLPVASVPFFDRRRTELALELCAALVEGFPAYELRFRPDGSVHDVLGGLW